MRRILALLAVALLLFAGCGQQTTAEGATSLVKASRETLLSRLLREAGVPLDQNQEILDDTSGDLGLDGTPDCAIVVQELMLDPEIVGLHQKRTLYVLTRTADGTWTCTGKNTGIILDDKSGGIFGDPYGGVAIKDGALTVSDYGGSAWRWGHTYTFSSEEDSLLLTAVVSSATSSWTTNGTYTAYDLKTGSVEEATMYWVRDSTGAVGPSAPVTLYRGTFTPQRIALEDAATWTETTLSPSPQYPMPDLQDYSYPGVGDPRPGPMNHSPEEVLDHVMATHYPAAEKIPLPCEQDILDNYSLLLGYPVPRYYYQTELGRLYYYDGLFDFDKATWGHTVLYTEPGPEGVYKPYQYEDSASLN